jgi:hypothetical protein
MKRMLSLTFILWFTFVASCATMKSATYEETVAQWTSYQNVASWMKTNFHFDYQRAKYWLSTRTKLQPRTPDQTFKLKSGICHDAAVFARDTLNRIDPKYDAKVLFIINSFGLPNHNVATFNHHVATFTMDGKLYIMDYGAGGPWGAMNGIHGPYDSLHGYAEFLSSLKLFQFEVGPMKYIYDF